ncbi:MAG: hypothetical protein P4L46_00895 [Fimbriimonas sp.]|nr:hypothetical protein [Fimbriimonas sp.]
MGLVGSFETMRRGIGVTIGFLIAAGYIAGLVTIYRAHVIRVRHAEVIPIRRPPAKILGNGDLTALIIDGEGHAEVLDGQKHLAMTSLSPADPSTRFLSGVLTPTGRVYLVDARKVLTRWSASRPMESSKPLKVDGDMLEITVEESRQILWCATLRHDLSPDALMLYAISLKNGKQIGSVNLEAHRGTISIVTSHAGNGIVLATSDSPGAFYFTVDGKTIRSKFLDAGDLVTSAAFSDADILLGLKSGPVLMVDSETGKLKHTFESDFLPVTQIAVDGRLIGIGHGDGDSSTGIGSFDVFDGSTGELKSKCGTRDRVTSVTSDGVAGQFVFGQRFGMVQIARDTDSRGAAEVSGLGALGEIRLIAIKDGCCLILGAKRACRFELPKLGD